MIMVRGSHDIAKRSSVRVPSCVYSAVFGWAIALSVFELLKPDGVSQPTRDEHCHNNCIVWEHGVEP